MKYYSEKLDKVFDTAEELRSAEAEAAPCELADVDDEVETKSESKEIAKTPTKKQLAANVDDAETKLKEAYADYDVAKQKVSELSKKYLEEMNAILNPAKNAVKKAEQARYEAIRKFNEAYGAYQVTYTGDRAAQEMLRAMEEINSIHKKLFSGWDNFWF